MLILLTLVLSFTAVISDETRDLLENVRTSPNPYMMDEATAPVGI